MRKELSETSVEKFADALWARPVGEDCDPIEPNLRAKLALEQHLLGTNAVPIGLGKRSPGEASSIPSSTAPHLSTRSSVAPSAWSSLTGAPMPNNLPSLLDRKQASEFLTSHGFGVAPRTLAKLACIGGGPAFRHFGRKVRYERPALLEWAEARLSPALRSTSEGSR
jgi:hypothetical protein